MGDRGPYRGVYSALADDPEFQQLPANARLLLYTLRLCRQAGPGVIFRYYPAVLAKQTGLPAKVVMAALKILEAHRWIEYDDAVVWVRNGLRYDPHVRLSDTKHRKAVEQHVRELPRREIVLRFCDYYEIGRPFVDPSQTHRWVSSDHASPPCIHIAPPNDSEEDRIPNTDRQGLGRPCDAASRNGIAFHIPEPVLTALGRAPRLGSEAVFQRPQFWQAQVRAHPTVDLARELLRAEAWLEANPRRRIQRLPRFLGNWFANADGDEEDVD